MHGCKRAHTDDTIISIGKASSTRNGLMIKREEQRESHDLRVDEQDRDFKVSL
jgi:hypothetical protein